MMTTKRFNPKQILALHGTVLLSSGPKGEFTVAHSIVGWACGSYVEEDDEGQAVERAALHAQPMILAGVVARPLCDGFGVISKPWKIVKVTTAQNYSLWNEGSDELLRLLDEQATASAVSSSD